MPYRILFVSSLHHPEVLRTAREQTPENPPLFPSSMAQHFWEKALCKRGHTLDVFYRNLPDGQLNRHAKHQRYSERITPGKVLAAMNHRIPAEFRVDLRRRNAELLAKVQAFKPDIVWMDGGNNVIYPDTLAQIQRDNGTLLVYASGDSPIVFSHTVERKATPLYDLVLVNDFYHGMQWVELGAKRMECLPISACDPDFHHPYLLSESERAALSCDIAFVGTLVPDHLYSRRVKALEALSEFDLGIWSVHDVPESLRRFVRGEALGEEMERIVSSAKICFNAHGDFMRYGGNLRLFEIAGAKVFQIADDLPGNRLWFPEVEGIPTLVRYSDHADLREKARFYLSHTEERETIAAQAQQHVYAHHTYNHRAAQFETLISDLHADGKEARLR